VAAWTVEFWRQDEKSPSYDWLVNQPPKVQARFLHVFELLEERGIQLGMPHIKHIKGKIYEIRVEQDTNAYRLLYFVFTGRRFVMLHGFEKKTAKTPPGEIEVAEKRMLSFVDPQEEDSSPLNKGTKQPSKKGKGKRK
jgi:phage-related protein